MAAETEASELDVRQVGVAARLELEADDDHVFDSALQAAQQTIRPLGRWLAWLSVPPAIGLGLIAVVVFNVGDSQVTKSAGTASVALVIGALLLLGSATLYVFSPRRYDLFFTDLRKRLQGKSPAMRAQAVAAVGGQQQALPTGSESQNDNPATSAETAPHTARKKKWGFF